MQPAEAAADPAEWAEGQQPSSQAAESHGSAPSAGASGRDADTADSAAAAAGARAGLTAEADGYVGGAAAEGAGPGDDLRDMQLEPAEHKLEKTMLEKGDGLDFIVLCCPVGMLMRCCCVLLAARFAGNLRWTCRQGRRVA